MSKAVILSARMSFTLYLTRIFHEMRMVMEDIRDRLREFGVEDPDSPNAEDLCKIFSLLLESKKIDKEMFNTYCDTIAPSLEVFFNGLKAFCESQQKSSDRYLTIVQEAVNILRHELQRDLSFEERKTIRDQIMMLIDKARDEADRQRSFLLKVASIGLAGVVCIGGIAILIASGGKNKELLTQGVNIAKNI